MRFATSLPRRLAAFVVGIGVDPEDGRGLRTRKAGLTISVLAGNAIVLFFLGPVLVLGGERLAGWLWIGFALSNLLHLGLYARTYRRFDVFCVVVLALGAILFAVETVLLGGLASSEGVYLWGLWIVSGALVSFPPRHAIPRLSRTSWRSC